MKIKDISINSLRRRKSKVFFLTLGLTIGISTAVTLISITQIMNDDISNKLDEYGANILIFPRSISLSLSYGGIALGGVTVDAETLKNSDIPKIRQIEERENINMISPKLIEIVEIEGKKVPLMGVLFQEEFLQKKWRKVKGAVPVTHEEVVLGSEVAGLFSKSPGDILNFRGRSLNVTGLSEDMGSPFTNFP